MTMFEFMQQSFYTLVSVALVGMTALIMYAVGKVILKGIGKDRRK